MAVRRRPALDGATEHNGVTVHCDDVVPVTHEASDWAYDMRTITACVSRYTVGHADPARGTTPTMTMKAPCNNRLDKIRKR